MAIFQSWYDSRCVRFRIRALKSLFRDHRVEFAEIRHHLRPGDIVFDIGANKGSFIYWLSCWVEHGRVIAFEPQQQLANDLSKICGIIGLENVTVEAKAVHSHSGNQELLLPTGHQPGASLVGVMAEAEGFTRLTVPVVALDEYLDAGEKVSLLKIDVEGAELGLLKGAKGLLQKQAPLLLLECDDRHASGNVEEVFSYLSDLGYEGSFVCRNRLFPISQFDKDIHQRREGKWFWKDKNYCSNFIFRKSV